jgi:hypothetical protein
VPWLTRSLVKWLPLAVLATALCVLVYLAVQQTWRHAANDPQVEIAADLAARLEQGTPARVLVPVETADLASSISPFVTLLDDNGGIVATSATLRGRERTVPPGVLDAVRKSGEERLTWQPEIGVRLATIVRRSTAPSGFIVVGRSLRESEARTLRFEKLLFLGWLGTLAAVFAAVAAGELVFGRRFVR